MGKDGYFYQSDFPLYSFLAIQFQFKARQYILAGKWPIKARDNLNFAIRPEDIRGLVFWIDEPGQPAAILYPDSKHFILCVIQRITRRKQFDHKIGA